MFHNLIFKISFFIIFLILLLLFFSGCSPESGNPLAKNYHNTTARYNPYFIAKERMKEVEAIMWKNNVDDFNQILNIFPFLNIQDTAQISTAANDCIKKASIAIQRHKNSKWTDKNFILIGKSRQYLKDYKNAIETYKYVNTKGKDKNAKHSSLINLMRLFIETKQYQDAVSVATYLRKETLNKDNERDFNLVKAYYFAHQQDFKKVESYLGFAIPGVDELSVRSRYYFIIAQIRQQNGENKEAFTSYNSALKNNPTYEIAFYSRLNMNQVTEVDNKGDLKKVNKNFAKLLKDIRNEDFKDKIYYEMARFELKQNNLDKGIEYLNKSIAASTVNSRQKAYSYLLLGKLYYEELKKYELAKAYYDSTIALLPPGETIYDVTLKRQKSLQNFVTQLNTIHTQDSLQRLAKMDSTTLQQYISKIEEDRDIAAQKQSVASLNNETFTSVFDSDPSTSNVRSRSNSDNANSSSGGWYFYSTAAISRGHTEFNKNWGKRPLEDNWRLSDKGNTLAEQNDSNQQEESTKDNLRGTKSNSFDKKQFLAQLPTTPEEIEASDNKIEEAYFVLAKIYDQELEEPKNAIQTFETMIKRFPETEHKSEIYYYLYLLNNKINSNNKDEYKNRLAGEFPNSFYNRLINNPNYLSESKREENILKKMYEDSYTMYENEYLEEASHKIDSILQRYPENILMDKFALLKVLIAGKTEAKDNYRQNLQQFIQRFPESPLVPYADQLLKKALSTDKPDIQKQIGSIYKENTENSPHYFLIYYPSATDMDEDLKNDIIKFNQTSPSDKGLKVEIMAEDISSKMMVVRQFSNKNQALNYYARFKDNSNLLNKYNGLNLTSFIISDENFQTFTRNKDVNSYLSFFEKTY